MFVPQFLSHEMVDRINRWDHLKRWERREIGQTLRRMGLSYREISAVIPVAKGTLSGWCRDIDLVPRLSARIDGSGRAGRVSAGRLRGAARRAAHLEQVAAIREAARAEVRSLRMDPFWVAGIMSYWAEGDKRSKELKFSNSDPDMIRLFLAWACRYLELSADRFTIMLHLHSGQDEQERHAFWSEVTGLPATQFRKTFIKPEGTGHRKNKLYNGTASIRVCRSSALVHRVLGWIDGLAIAFVYPR